ncbi:MAG: CsbD family protein [Actinomycetota bacterium]|nr:CsbD family protein [Actinomycetota bacterium]
MKEAEGKLTGDEDREKEGQAQDATGKVKDTASDAWDKVKDTGEDAKDAVDKRV